MSTPSVMDVSTNFLRILRMKTVLVNIIIWVFFLRRWIIFLKDLRASLLMFAILATRSWLPIHWIVYSLLVFWCISVVSALAAASPICCAAVFARGQNIMPCLMLITRRMATPWIIVLSDCRFQIFRKVFVWWLRCCCARRRSMLTACWGAIIWWRSMAPVWSLFMSAIVIIGSPTSLMLA